MLLFGCAFVAIGALAPPAPLVQNLETLLRGVPIHSVLFASLGAWLGSQLPPCQDRGLDRRFHHTKIGVWIADSTLPRSWIGPQYFVAQLADESLHVVYIYI